MALRKRHGSLRAVFACSFAALLAFLQCPAVAAQYFLGEIEFDINGESVQYSHAWECEKKTVFRPADRSLFEQVDRQKTRSDEPFVARRFGRDHVIVFNNWTGCRSGTRQARNPLSVTLMDSAATPTYGERLYLDVGAPATVHNGFEKTFKARLVKDVITEVDAHRYEEIVAHQSDEGPALLYQLRLKAAYRLVVDVLTWNDTDKEGLREGLARNKNVWEVERLRAPPLRYSATSSVENASLLPLPLGYKGADGRLSPPLGTRVRYANKVIELDDRGFAEIQRPEPGIKLVRFYARVDTNGWASICVFRPNPPPQCPPLPAGTR